MIFNGNLPKRPTIDQRVKNSDYCPFHPDPYKYKFVPFKIKDRNGNIEMGRKCPRCAVTVNIDKPKLETAKIEAYTNDEAVQGVK